MTRSEDARAAADLGADAIGLIFYPPSPRSVSIEQALKVLDGLPPLVTTVGVFVDPSDEELDTVLARVPLDLLQFHGQEDAATCHRSGRPWIKAIGMRDASSLEGIDDFDTDAILCDTSVGGRSGGTGFSEPGRLPG